MYEYFNKIKSELDLNREKCIKQIEDKYFEKLKQIEEAEESCKSNLKSNEISPDVNEANKSFKEKLNEFSASSNKTDIIDTETFSYFKFNIQKMIIIAEYQLKKFESTLLMSKRYQLIPHESFKDIGELYVLDNEFSKKVRVINELQTFLYRFLNLINF